MFLKPITTRPHKSIFQSIMFRDYIIGLLWQKLEIQNIRVRLTGESGFTWEMARGIFWSTPPWGYCIKSKENKKNCFMQRNNRCMRLARPTLTLKPNLPSWSGVMEIIIRSPSLRLPFAKRVRQPLEKNFNAIVVVSWFDDQLDWPCCTGVNCCHPRHRRYCHWPAMQPRLSGCCKSQEEWRRQN